MPHNLKVMRLYFTLLYNIIRPMYNIDLLITLVSEYIEKNQYNAAPQGMYAPVNYILSIGGKRIRPVLMLMAYNLYKDTPADIIEQAVALETYHNFTLLHDDLMDKSDLRRGNPTVHRKWNENTAILSGDAMLILAYKLFGSNCALGDFTSATLGVCEGQQYDMEFETRNDVTEAEYMEMIRLKTSLLLGYALKIGARLAGASETDCQNLYSFGEKMGLAFQLQDDVLDVYGDPELFKKKLGADIVDNKKTYLLIKALELANSEQHTELTKWINATTFDADEKIAAVKAIYDNINIQSIAQNRIEELFAESLTSLQRVSVPEKQKSELYAFANRLLGRKY